MFCSLRYRLFWNWWFACDWLYFSLSRWSIVLLWARISGWCLNYQIRKTKNCWHSMDAHFQDGVGSVSLLFLPLMAANVSSMDGCNQSECRLPKIQTQQLLTLCWRSFSEWGSDCVAFSFAYKGCQYVGYAYHPPNHFSITVLTRLEIVDALMMLISVYCPFNGICCNQ